MYDTTKRRCLCVSKSARNDELPLPLTVVNCKTRLRADANGRKHSGTRTSAGFCRRAALLFVPLAETGRAQPRQRLQKNKQKHTLSGSNQERISQAHINQPDPAATSCLRELCTVDALNQALATLPQKQSGSRHTCRMYQADNGKQRCMRPSKLQHDLASVTHLQHHWCGPSSSSKAAHQKEAHIAEGSIGESTLKSRGNKELCMLHCSRQGSAGSTGPHHAQAYPTHTPELLASATVALTKAETKVTKRQTGPCW
jgi:hypothetical protein